MNLIQLIYSSKIEENCSASDIEQILESARRHNISNRVTGLLCLANGHFLQILEGNRKSVSDTFCHITKDPRHSDVILLDCSPIAKRQFATWTMGYVGETKSNRATFLQFSTTDYFEPHQMSRDSALHLLLALSDTLREGKIPVAA